VLEVLKNLFFFYISSVSKVHERVSSSCSNAAKGPCCGFDGL
jgi:hypothetical protein